MLDEVQIAVNKNQIRSTRTRRRHPRASGVGTPAPSTLGMDEAEMREIGSIIGDVVRTPDDGGRRRRRAAA